jgi:CheY-like chemotaxis protein
MPRKPVVLCVDDERNGLEGREILEASCEVLVATTGADALLLFTSHPVDVVLLDYHMLGMDRDVVVKHMKTIQPDVPIALLSADEGLPESALKWVDGFVSKSESPANLLQWEESFSPESADLSGLLLPRPHLRPPASARKKIAMAQRKRHGALCRSRWRRLRFLPCGCPPLFLREADPLASSSR